MIARTRNATCPGAMLELYMRQTHTPWDDQQFLFRPIYKFSEDERLRGSSYISYSCLCDLFKKKLEALGKKSGEYGQHSLRAGRATAAANLGVADRLFSIMVVGSPRMLRTAMLRISRSSGWGFQGAWGYS